MTSARVGRLAVDGDPDALQVGHDDGSSVRFPLPGFGADDEPVSPGILPTGNGDGMNLMDVNFQIVGRTQQAGD